mgnify:CR=1 FL=1
MKTTPTTTAERLAIASAKVRAAEAANMSASTIARRYREFFAAEDACKALAAGWSL